MVKRLILVISLILVACGHKNNPEMIFNNNQIEPQEITDRDIINLDSEENNWDNYDLSLTVTDEDLNSAIYYLNQDRLEKVFEFKFNNDYPLGIYLSKLNKVFYTAKEDGINYLKSFDLNTKEDLKLSDKLSAINYLQYFDNKLYLVASDQDLNDRVMYLFTYDLNSNQLEKIDFGLSINDFKILDGKFYFTAWNIEDLNKFLNSEIDYPLSNLFQYQIKENQLTKLAEVNLVNPDFTIYNNYIYWLDKDHYYQVYNLNDQSLSKYNYANGENQKLRANIDFYQKGLKVDYYGNTIVIYNNKSELVKEIFNKQFINNMTVIEK